MSINKTDFAVIIEVTNANPNGDPLNGNRPRTTYEGLGEISDVCIKRKIRNRLQDLGQNIFVQSEDRSNDGFSSLRERFDSLGIKLSKKSTLEDKRNIKTVLCNQWIDIRAFGQVFAFKGSEMSLGIRGAVSIQPAYSLDTVDIIDTQITKSVNSEKTDGKASDTMGMKYSVDFGVYVLYGSISSVVSENNELTEEDVTVIKEAIETMFENDFSSSRPEGTMNVRKVVWWTHENSRGNASTGKVHNSLKIEKLKETPSSYEDYEITILPIQGVNAEIIDVY